MVAWSNKLGLYKLSSSNFFTQLLGIAFYLAGDGIDPVLVITMEGLQKPLDALLKKGSIQQKDAEAFFTQYFKYIQDSGLPGDMEELAKRIVARKQNSMSDSSYSSWRVRKDKERDLYEIYNVKKVEDDHLVISTFSMALEICKGLCENKRMYLTEACFVMGRVVELHLPLSDTLDSGEVASVLTENN